MANGASAGWHSGGAEELRRSWAWFLLLGILLIILGVVAIGVAAATTVVSVLMFGWLILIGGVLQAGHAFWRRAWSGFFLDLLTGLLYVVVGMIMVGHPLASAMGLTLVIALALMFGGIFRIVVSIAVQFQHWPWVLLNGAISLLLGIAIWRQWPLSGLWVIGLFVGIEMLFNGFALLMLGLTARRLPKGGVQ